MTTSNESVLMDINRMAIETKDVSLKNKAVPVQNKGVSCPAGTDALTQGQHTSKDSAMDTISVCILLWLLTWASLARLTIEMCLPWGADASEYPKIAEEKDTYLPGSFELIMNKLFYI